MSDSNTRLPLCRRGTLAAELIRYGESGRIRTSTTISGREFSKLVRLPVSSHFRKIGRPYRIRTDMHSV